MQCCYSERALRLHLSPGDVLGQLVGQLLLLGREVLDVLAQLHILALVLLEALVGCVQLLLNGPVLLALLLEPERHMHQLRRE